MQRIDQSIVIVVRKTRLDALTAKYSTKGQARFHVARARMQQAVKAGRGGGAELKQVEAAALAEMSRVEEEGQRYQEVVAEVRGMLDFDLPVNVVDRSLVPNMVFGPRDVVVAIGQDGLVANVAKYAVGLPIIGVNPDASAYDGILLPFEWKEAGAAVQRTLEGRARLREVTLAEARLSDGQRLLAFNDLFIGARSHVSARYRLEVGSAEENQSSSGMIISTGAGSTGWLSSVLNMAAGVMRLGGAAVSRPAVRMSWEDRRLLYVVREPFVSRRSGASLVSGLLEEGEELTVESMMGAEGVIFSDGVESDALAFGEGVIATIGVARERAQLVVG